MLSLRVARDKRGYDQIYLFLEGRRKGRPEGRLLYWGRVPTPLRVGQPPLDESVRTHLEDTFPDVHFDWASIFKTLIALTSAPRPSPSGRLRRDGPDGGRAGGRNGSAQNARGSGRAGRPNGNPGGPSPRPHPDADRGRRPVAPSHADAYPEALSHSEDPDLLEHADEAGDHGDHIDVVGVESFVFETRVPADGTAGLGDDLSDEELDEALAAGLAQTDVEPLDLTDAAADAAPDTVLSTPPSASAAAAAAAAASESGASELGATSSVDPRGEPRSPQDPAMRDPNRPRRRRRRGGRGGRHQAGRPERGPDGVAAESDGGREPADAGADDGPDRDSDADSDAD